MERARQTTKRSDGGADAASVRDRHGAEREQRSASGTDGNPEVPVQHASMAWIKASPRMAAQRAQIEGAFGDAARSRREAGTQRFRPATVQARSAASPVHAGEAPSPGNTNDTGLPDGLKAGVESLAGFNLDHVRVHYNSSRPLQLNAYGYAQGRDIHLAPGQEGHLAHETWHVVQQAQGRVRPTTEVQPGVPVNDDRRLEREADVMGAMARSLGEQRNAGPGTSRKATDVPDGRHKGIRPMGTASGLPVQGVFRATGKDEAVPEEEIVKMLSDDDEFERHVVSHVKSAPNLPRLVHKLAEGPDITFDPSTPSDLREKVKARLNARATRGFMHQKGTVGAAFRKLNRIAGQLEMKLRKVKPPMLEKLQPIAELANKVLLAPSNTDAVALMEACHRALADFADTDMRRAWFSYDFVSEFGPLGHAMLSNMPPSVAVRETIAEWHQKNLALLREIRQRMAQRDEVSIVAHRGSGPTNRTMGGLITEEDNRRKNRPAENSPDAFGAALSQASKPGKPALDGVECDVFLSSNGVPIVTHEGKVREQLNAARKSATPSVKAHTEVRGLPSSELVKITRTASPGSRFMTLAELLDMVRPVALEYYEYTGHPFRVEVEMKGTKADVSPGALRDAVGKVISKALKSNAGIPVDYVLFNGEATDVADFASLRTTKSALGGLYTALGNIDAPADPEHVDELRYMFFKDVKDPGKNTGALPLTSHFQKDFITTVVPAQEFAPSELNDELGDQEPSHHLSGGIESAKKGLTSDLQARASHKPTTDDHLQRILEEYTANGGRIDKLHVLTDYPKKAQWVKKRFVVKLRISGLDKSVGGEDLDVAAHSEGLRIFSAAFTAEPEDKQSCVVEVPNAVAASKMIAAWNGKKIEGLYHDGGPALTVKRLPG